MRGLLFLLMAKSNEEIERDKKLHELERILLGAREMKASDVHFKVGYKPIVRINGTPDQINTEVVDEIKIIDIVDLILNKNKQDYFHKHKNVDASLEVIGRDKNTKKEVEYRHRVNVGYARKQPFITIRLIPDKIMSVDEIGFPYEVWKNIVGCEEEEITGLKRGLILITGVAGSGKTTTQASLLQEINKRRKENIITVEDPIEYTYPRGKSIISQRELGDDLNSFADGIKYSLRQDPDVILIGEIRDRETALHNLEAAETGHLVFSTLHTKDAAETVRRYVNLFDTDDHDNIRDSLSANLSYVLCQQLIPYQKGVGRRLAMEVMNVRDSAAIRKHIRDGEYHKIPGQMQLEKAHKSILMDDHIKYLCTKGEIKLEDALAQAYNSERLKEDLDKVK